jgi:type VI secretion system protein ImpH
VNDELQNNPSAFDFFAAVRLLEQAAGGNGAPAVRSDRLQPGEGAPRQPADAVRSRRRPAKAGHYEPVGGDSDPRHEVVRFTAHPSLTFSMGDIHRMEANAAESGGSVQPRMSVDFLGLIGPNGALPQHYTSLILARMRERDSAFRDFLDLFHHRSISLFYRAWKKYRLPFQYQGRESGPAPDGHAGPHASSGPDAIDLATLCLYALTGLGTGGLRGRRTFDDRVCLFFGGTFSRQARPALELERMLSVQMGVPVRVEQFFGRWLTLGNNELSRLAGGARETERYNRLGVNVVIGQRIRDVQNSFRLVLGPLDYRQFHRFSPLGSDLRPLCELTRSFVGPEFEFDVQVILAPRQVPECRLDSTPTGPRDASGPAHPSGAGPRLGWNTWLRSNEIDRESADAVFLLSNV